MKEHINEIITNVLAGEATAEEELILIDWLGESDENQQYFTESEKAWNTFNIARHRNKYDYRSAFNKFSLNIRKPKRTKEQVNYRILLRSSLKWASIGIILLAIGSVFSYFMIRHENNNNRKTIEISSPYGSRSNVILADGSSVWLNAGSKLKYSQNFGSIDRIIYLEGEGFFNVEKDTRKPFTVITSQLEIVALGTSFNVKSYPEEGYIQTTLISGSLQVTRSQSKQEDAGLVLEPNQQITYYKGSEKMLLTRESDTGEKDKVEPVQRARTPVQAPPRIVMSRGIDPEIFTAWKDNRLIFDNEPFESIAIKLERRFGARIIIEDEEIKNKKFKGRFEEITIEQALTALKFASPFEFYIKEDTIFITCQTEKKP
jgi:transmembrane sensor